MHCKSLWIKASVKCVNVNVINYLRRRVSRRKTINGKVVMIDNSGRQYRNTLMADFTQAFQNDRNNISDAVQRD